MVESKLASPIKLKTVAIASYNVSSVVLCVQYAKQPGCILISDLAVANLFMHSLPCMIPLYLAAPSFTPRVFLHEILSVL